LAPLRREIRRKKAVLEGRRQKKVERGFHIERGRGEEEGVERTRRTVFGSKGRDEGEILSRKVGAQPSSKASGEKGRLIIAAQLRGRPPRIYRCCIFF